MKLLLPAFQPSCRLADPERSLRVMRPAAHAHLLNFVQRLITGSAGGGRWCSTTENPGMDIVNIRYDARGRNAYFSNPLSSARTRAASQRVYALQVISYWSASDRRTSSGWSIPVCGYYVGQLFHIPAAGKFPVLVRAPGQLLIMSGN